MSKKTLPLATRLPHDLVRRLDRICEQLGYRKNFVIESALRDKLEDLVDAHELTRALSDSGPRYTWESVKAEDDRRRRRRPRTESS